MGWGNPHDHCIFPLNQSTTLLTDSSEVTHVLDWFFNSWTSSSCFWGIHTGQNADSLENLAQDDKISGGSSCFEHQERFGSSEGLVQSLMVPGSYWFIIMCWILAGSQLRSCVTPWICPSNPAWGLFYKENAGEALCNWLRWLNVGENITGWSVPLRCQWEII